MKTPLRKIAVVAHLWLGLITGLFVSLMGFTGGLVALRPQIATLLSPPSPQVPVCQATDWNRAAEDVIAVTHSEINRVYGPYGSDTRYHFRMTTRTPVIYKHVIYDACAGRVLGSIDMGWMDWTVDLHHNLLAGNTGRRWAGAIGIAMLLSGITGLCVWALTKPNLRTAFSIQLHFSRRTPREMHRAIGLIAAFILVLEAFTGLWLCFPQTMRDVLITVAPAPEDVRPVRTAAPPASSPAMQTPKRPSSKPPSPPAGFGELIAAAHAAVPDGFIREIRMPDGNGTVQIRMWRPGDFRSLGNNVVYISRNRAQVVAMDRYSERSGSNQFVQAMAGLHYDEWGGLPLRILFAVFGLLTPVLFVTGILIWWFSRRRKTTPAARQAAMNAEATLTR
jgi:uncharacterized iron-regulated membrane protein